MLSKLSMTELKQRLDSVTSLDDPIVAALKTDSRKGAIRLGQQLEKRLAKAAELKAQAYERQHYERQALAKGYQLIAGIDEVGRGPLAGPVVAAAVILPADFKLLEVNDSKKLSEKKRDELFEQITNQAIAIGIGLIDEQVIDQVNIYQGTKLAMISAVQQLSVKPDYLLIDAMVLENVEIAQESIIKGDAKSVSIAAASIIAKVTRDRLMKDYDQQYPGYYFSKNAGYGTKEHLMGLEKLGPCPIHRKTFAPVKFYFE